MIDSHELAWAAGFFDGEGHVRRTPKGELRMHVWQKDPRCLARFVAAIGGSRIYGPYYGESERATMFNVQVTGAKAEKAMQMLLPYLSEPKREQAKVAGVE